MSTEDGGFDPATANQLTVLALTNAIGQQQLNSMTSRNQIAGMASVMTMNIHLNHLAAIQRIFGWAPCDGAALLQLQAALQTPQTPQGS